ncbi:MAG: hypothetical protein ACRDXB_11185 [Actinomycetes bacterium]
MDLGERLPRLFDPDPEDAMKYDRVVSLIHDVTDIPSATAARAVDALIGNPRVLRGLMDLVTDDETKEGV